MVTLKAASDGMSEQGHGEKSFRAQGYPAWAVIPKNGDDGVCIKPLSSQMVQGRKNVFLLYLNVF